MIDTRIHIPSDSFFALRDGLISRDYSTESFKVLGFYAYDDFYEFGMKIGLMESRITKVLDKYRNENGETRDLINRSFLGAEAKTIFGSHYADRLRMLNNSYAKKI